MAHSGTSFRVDGPGLALSGVGPPRAPSRRLLALPPSSSRRICFPPACAAPRRSGRCTLSSQQPGEAASEREPSVPPPPGASWASAPSAWSCPSPAPPWRCTVQGVPVPRKRGRPRRDCCAASPPGCGQEGPAGAPPSQPSESRLSSRAVSEQKRRQLCARVQRTLLCRHGFTPGPVCGGPQPRARHSPPGEAWPASGMQRSAELAGGSSLTPVGSGPYQAQRCLQNPPPRSPPHPCACFPAGGNRTGRGGGAGLEWP